MPGLRKEEGLKLKKPRPIEQLALKAADTVMKVKKINASSMKLKAACK